TLQGSIINSRARQCPGSNGAPRHADARLQFHAIQVNNSAIVQNVGKDKVEAGQTRGDFKRGAEVVRNLRRAVAREKGVYWIRKTSAVLDAEQSQTTLPSRS